MCVELYTYVCVSQKYSEIWIMIKFELVDFVILQIVLCDICLSSDEYSFGDNYIYRVFMFVYHVHTFSTSVWKKIFVSDFFGLISMNSIDFNLGIYPISVIIFKDFMVSYACYFTNLQV